MDDDITEDAGEVARLLAVIADRDGDTTNCECGAVAVCVGQFEGDGLPLVCCSACCNHEDFEECGRCWPLDGPKSYHWCSAVFMPEIVKLAKLLDLDWWVSRREPGRQRVLVMFTVEPGWVSPWVPAPRSYAVGGEQRYTFLARDDLAGWMPIECQWRESSTP